MTKRTFPIGDILTVTTGRVVAERGILAVYDLIEFLTGRRPDPLQVSTLAKICGPRLLRQLPQLGDPDVERAVARLDRALQEGEASREPYHEVAAALQGIVDDWRRDMAATLGAEFEVSTLPEGDVALDDSPCELARTHEGPTPDPARPVDKFPHYRGYLILPFVHSQPFWIEGRWVKFGYHVTSADGTWVNVLPGAAWCRTIERARACVDALLAVGGGLRGELPDGAASKFWELVRGQESAHAEDAP